jgi:hypothetical protein
VTGLAFQVRIQTVSTAAIQASAKPPPFRQRIHGCEHV